MLTPQWAGAQSAADSFDEDASLLDAYSGAVIGRDGELQLLRRSSIIRVKIRPIELPTREA